MVYNIINLYKIFYGDKRLEEQKNDNIKNIYCDKNSINLIRISYKEIEIKDIIETIINKTIN
jgi:hypothetical protein